MAEKIVSVGANQLKLTINETSVNIGANSSTIYEKLELILPYSNSYFEASNTRAKTSGSTEQNYGYVNWHGIQTIKLAEATYDVTHNQDGSKTYTSNGYLYSGAGNWNINCDITLTKIDKVAYTNSVEGNDVKGVFKINYTKYVDDYTYKLRVSIPNVVLLQRVDYNTSGANFSFNSGALSALLEHMTSDNIQLGFRIETYDGDTMISEGNEIIITAYLFNSNPTYDVAYLDTNPTTTAITQNNQQIIRNNSTLQFNLTNMTALDDATLSSAKVEIDGTTYNGTISGSTCTINIGTLNLSSNVTAVVTVTDSRNIATIKNVAITILDWQLPTGIITLERQSNYYTDTDIKVDADYSSLDNKNVLTLKVRYKKVGESTYGAYTTLQDNVTTTLQLDNLYSWDVQVLVQDLIGSTTYNLSVGIGLPILYIDRLKRSVGIECFPQDTNSLEVGGINVIKKIEDLYDNTETTTNKKWINNETIYRKVIDTGSISSANKTIAHDITNLGVVISLTGMCTALNGSQYTLPRISTQNINQQIALFADSTNVGLQVGSDANFDSSFVIIEYTKSS